MIYAHLNTSVKDMAQLPIDNYWFYFIYYAESFKKETLQTLCIDWLSTLLYTKCPFQLEHLDSFPYCCSFTTPESSWRVKQGAARPTSAPNCFVWAFGSVGLASSRLSTTMPLNMAKPLHLWHYENNKNQQLGFVFISAHAYTRKYTQNDLLLLLFGPFQNIYF